MQKINKNSIEKLFSAVLSLKDSDECSAFFEDICTYQELEALAQRLEVASLLLEKKSYIDINKITGASTATICRVSKCLNYGDGGYKTVLERIKED